MKEEKLREQLVRINQELKSCLEAVESKIRWLKVLGVDIEKIVMKLKKKED